VFDVVALIVNADPHYPLSRYPAPLRTALGRREEVCVEHSLIRREINLWKQILGL